jgi:hypothetical protein
LDVHIQLPVRDVIEQSSSYAWNGIDEVISVRDEADSSSDQHTPRQLLL